MQGEQVLLTRLYAGALVFSWQRLTCFIATSACWLDNVLHNITGTLWERAPLTEDQTGVTEALEQLKQSYEQKNPRGGKDIQQSVM